MTGLFETGPALSRHRRLRHGFFGRQGGVSQGGFGALNVSEASADEPGKIAENRARIAVAMGFAPHSLLSLKQVHSNRVIAVGAGADATARPDADALVSATPGVLLGILTADCCPILLCDAESGVIGAAHAGWRGAVDGVVGATVTAMVELGARRDAIEAALGPTISATSYEVGPDFMAEVLARDPEAERHFSRPASNREHFDLSGFVVARLREAGIARIEIVGGCTYTHPERYFSHRHATHNQQVAGRQMAVIGIA